VMDDKPIEEVPINEMILSIFASRTYSELERINANRNLITARDEAEKANRAKSDFLSRMSHEFRTPLNAILGFGQLMIRKQETLGGDHMDSVEQILMSGKHLLELVNEVLDLSTVESSHLVIQTQAVSIGPLIAEVLSLSLTMARERGIGIINNIPEDGGFRVSADPLRLRQVLINLLSNAIKYNRENGNVTLNGMYLEEGRVRLEVRDTGKGIPEDQLDRIYEPFERLGAEYSEVLGTGIGLTICQSLITQMKGTLEAESFPGRGSCFSVELPVASISSQFTETRQAKNV